jgi:hypothetical protein
MNEKETFVERWAIDKGEAEEPRGKLTTIPRFNHKFPSKLA